MQKSSRGQANFLGELGVGARNRARPLGQVMVVLNHRMEDRDKNGTFRSTLTDLNAKLSYTFRF